MDSGTQEEYTSIATRKNVPLRIGYLMHQLNRWRRFRPPEFYGPSIEYEDDPTETTLGFDIIPEPDYPNIVINPWNGEDVTTLHLLYTIHETPGPKNCFHAHNGFDPTPLILAKPAWPTSDFWLQACTWKVNGTHPALSNKLPISV
jgi:hypothetical protein